MEHVDDAHSSVQSALQAVGSIELATLNETEREHAIAALNQLHDLDEALAVRSGYDAEQLGKDDLGEMQAIDDEEEADDA